MCRRPSRDEVTSDLKHRPEGVRIKHRAGKNSVKLSTISKARCRESETTLNEVKGLRASADDPSGPCQWRPMQGVAG